ncbi:hypothetical protein L861_08845 [Litchfieldella anticariensis FP35 = DSM 16096]|uniref:Uncharacterized protein n=1 Tax=Litchfieldella anticariensis (strain DSM 16096 / CECT 5854 / CIP 108499 / LMG 22089 / FP35) TaxID=1121939 RepID=S2LCK2_LITA3|nr:hypothetical protein L861_08845 [Halomonas anticariensis FP35 = DSM 16096]
MEKSGYQTVVKPRACVVSSQTHGCTKTDRFSAQAGRGVDGAPGGETKVSNKAVATY